MKTITQHIFLDLRYLFACIAVLGAFTMPLHNARADVPYQNPYYTYTQEQYNEQYYRYLREYSQFYNIPQPYYPGYDPKRGSPEYNSRALAPYRERNQLYPEYYLE